MRARFMAAEMPGFYRKSSENEGVLDLSSRRDSVETPRKTPSPYNTNSSYGEPSPTGSHEFPSHNTSADQHKFPSHSNQHYLTSTSFNSAGTPPAPIYHPYTYHGGNQTAFPYDTKCEMVSPRGSAMPTEERLRHVESHISPFMLNAVAYQQQMAQAQLAAQVQQESPAASPTTSSPIEASVPTSSASSLYPMIMGRDGKLARPFKAYPRDPLSISAGFTTSEAIDAQSVDEYNAFRKRILHDICEANGGTPTLSNPKMRRIAKSTSSNNSNGSELTVSSSSNTALAAGLIQAAAVAAASIAAERKNIQDAQQKMADDADMDTDAVNDAASLDYDGSVKDSAYYERRKKNNAAAKKSRDRRRIKEDEIAIRAAFLERENLELKVKLAAAYQHLDMLGIVMQPLPMQVTSP